MKNISKEKKLENIQLPKVKASAYKSMLEKALMQSPHWDKKIPVRNFLWKGGEEIMRKNKFVALGFSLSIMVLVVVVALNLMPKNTKTAYAEQIAQQSMEAVSGLTPEQLQTLKQKLPMDPNEVLQEAKNAKDLKTLTYDEFVKEYPDVKMGFSTGGGKMGFGTDGKNVGYGFMAKGPSITPPPPPPGASEIETMDMRTFKFLQFTDANEGKVVLGIDKNNLPIFVFRKGKDGTISGSFHGAGSMKGETRFHSETNNRVGSHMKEEGFGVSSNDGKTIIVNGKKYAVPAETTEPSTVQVKGDDVYINGIKATPEE